MTKSVGRFHTRAGSTSGLPRRALAGVVVLVSLAACGGTPSTASETTLGAGSATVPQPVQVTQAPSTDSKPPADVSETTVGVVAASVPELLQFTAPLVGGGEFNGATRAGLATAFWFWAPT